MIEQTSRLARYAVGELLQLKYVRVIFEIETGETQAPVKLSLTSGVYFFHDQSSLNVILFLRILTWPQDEREKLEDMFSTLDLENDEARVLIIGF